MILELLTRLLKAGDPCPWFEPWKADVPRRCPGLLPGWRWGNAMWETYPSLAGVCCCAATEFGRGGCSALMALTWFDTRVRWAALVLGCVFGCPLSRGACTKQGVSLSASCLLSAEGLEEQIKWRPVLFPGCSGHPHSTGHHRVGLADCVGLWAHLSHLRGLTRLCSDRAHSVYALGIWTGALYSNLVALGRNKPVWRYSAHSYHRSFALRFLPSFFSKSSSFLILVGHRSKHNAYYVKAAAYIPTADFLTEKAF